MLISLVVGLMSMLSLILPLQNLGWVGLSLMPIIQSCELSMKSQITLSRTKVEEIALSSALGGAIPLVEHQMSYKMSSNQFFCFNADICAMVLRITFEHLKLPSIQRCIPKISKLRFAIPGTCQARGNKALCHQYQKLTDMPNMLLPQNLLHKDHKFLLGTYSTISVTKLQIIWPGNAMLFT